jgi:hypothetical protein
MIKLRNISFNLIKFYIYLIKFNIFNFICEKITLLKRKNENLNSFFIIKSKYLIIFKKYKNKIQ